MASMEDLVVKPVQFKNFRSLRKWQIIAATACIVAVIMTVLFVWQVLKNGQQSNSDTGHSGGKSARSTKAMDQFGQPCPAVPSLSAVFDPLPSGLSKALDKIDEYVNSFVNQSVGLPSISLNVYYQDRVLRSSHFGRKTYRGEHKPDNGTVYRIGSITKVFVVLMVYKLYEDGLIDSLDDSLCKYAPQFYIQNPFTGQNVTIRQITTQMSGLPREAPCFFFCNVTTEHQLMLLRNRSLVVPPWTVPSYSNLGYALLGRLLPERLLQTTFERWVEENILKPLNMTETGFRITEDVQRNLAFPHFKNGTIMPFMKLGWLAPAGEMYSSLNDLTKFGKLFTQPSKQNLLRPSSLREMMLPADIATDGRTLWGAPWEIEFFKHFPIRGKGGTIDSYTGIFSVVPELQLGMTLLIGSKDFATEDAFPSKMAHDIYNTLIPAVNKTLFELQTSSTFRNPRPYVGNYILNRTDILTSKRSSVEARVVAKNNILVVYYGTKHSFEIRDIGDKLIFQAYFGESSDSCLIETLGSYEDLHFFPFDANGLSPGFRVPGWNHMIATRSSSAE